MKTPHIIIISIMFIIILIILLTSKSSININNKENKNISEVCFKKNCFFVELAKTNEEKEKGLMYRESLGNDKGMLFVYDIPKKVAFWMKNTLIPLDIIWINKDRKVVQIITAYPCKKDPCEIYSSDEEALYILEINANLSKELNIKEGDFVII